MFGIWRMCLAGLEEVNQTHVSMKVGMNLIELFARKKMEAQCVHFERAMGLQ